MTPSLLPLPGASHYFDASTLTLDNGDTCANWPDLSGHGNDAIQSVRGSRPIFRTNIMNGEPVLLFDGTDDFMVLPVSSKAVTVFLALHCPTLVTGNATAAILSFRNLATLFYDQRESAQEVWWFRDSTSTALAAPLDTATQNAPVTLQLGPGFNRCWYNGVLAWDAATGPTDQPWPAEEMILGARNPDAPYGHASFGFGAVAIYPHELNRWDRATVEGVFAKFIPAT